jgi:hypothetical protein
MDARAMDANLGYCRSCRDQRRRRSDTDEQFPHCILLNCILLICTYDNASQNASFPKTFVGGTTVPAIRAFHARHLDCLDDVVLVNESVWADENAFRLFCRRKDARLCAAVRSVRCRLTAAAMH